MGKGVLNAVNNVNTVLKEALKVNLFLIKQRLIITCVPWMALLIKAKLGANAILGVSLAIAKAAASKKECRCTNTLAEWVQIPYRFQ
jgi:enolase